MVMGVVIFTIAFHCLSLSPTFIFFWKKKPKKKRTATVSLSDLYFFQKKKTEKM